MAAATAEKTAGRSAEHSVRHWVAMKVSTKDFLWVGWKALLKADSSADWMAHRMVAW